MRRIAKSCGEQQVISVGAGSRFPGVHGHRLKQTSRWVTPLVEIETEEGNVNMQILETEPHHAEDNLYRPLGFIILINGKLLSSAEPSGEVINWIGEKASSNQIDLIKNNVLPLMEEEYLKLPRLESKPISDELDSYKIFKGRIPSRFSGPEKGNYPTD